MVWESVFSCTVQGVASWWIGCGIEMKSKSSDLGYRKRPQSLPPSCFWLCIISSLTGWGLDKHGWHNRSCILIQCVINRVIHTHCPIIAVDTAIRWFHENQWSEVFSLSSKDTSLTERVYSMNHSGMKTAFNRHFAVGRSVGGAKCTATILEYNVHVWAFSMGHKYRECVCSSFVMNQNE